MLEMKKKHTKRISGVDFECVVGDQAVQLTKGTNNIFCTDENGPDMVLNYTKSTEIVIKKLEQAIIALGGV